MLKVMEDMRLRLGRRRRKRFIGIEITSATIKLIELSRGKEGVRVDSYSVRPVREGSVVERRIQDSIDVSNVLQDVVRAAKPKTRRAAVVIPSQGTITKTLNYPVSLTNDEIFARLETMPDGEMPFPMSEVAFDFQRLGAPDGRMDRDEVLVVACRRQNVNERAQVLREAGLEPEVADVETYAMERAYRWLASGIEGFSYQNEGAALIDIGARLTGFHALVGGRSLYNREIFLGGADLTDRIAKQFGLSVSEAGFGKRRGGLPDTYENLVLGPFIDELCDQVIRSLQLYATVNHRVELSRIILAGGSCVIPGLVEKLSDVTGLPVTIADPFTGMVINESRVDVDALREDGPAMLTAAGLAMKGV